ncbi:hypothetical protein C942_04045 [Photobacterium marinum]|uniref:Uncharacterized protein n=1 Tax=Photobacterium marinum TaxID=1056511 RepID=L8J6C6_9GAMM|nr:hypothetical protein C942_04045 [Photobacterium marinum]
MAFCKRLNAIRTHVDTRFQAVQQLSRIRKGLKLIATELTNHFQHFLQDRHAVNRLTISGYDMTASSVIHTEDITQCCLSTDTSQFTQQLVLQLTRQILRVIGKGCFRLTGCRELLCHQAEKRTQVGVQNRLDIVTEHEVPVTRSYLDIGTLTTNSKVKCQLLICLAELVCPAHGAGIHAVITTAKPLVILLVQRCLGVMLQATTTALMLRVQINQAGVIHAAALIQTGHILHKLLRTGQCPLLILSCQPILTFSGAGNALQYTGDT